MFTIDEIQSAHSKVKSGADFPNYVKDLIQLGVKNYKTQVENGITHYFGASGHSVHSQPKYETLIIESNSNKNQFIADLKAHQAGKTDYKKFCEDCASSGIDYWLVDLDLKTCTYFDLKGNVILVEKIPV